MYIDPINPVYSSDPKSVYSGEVISFYFGLALFPEQLICVLMKGRFFKQYLNVP